MEPDGVCGKEELGDDRVGALDEASRIGEADKRCLEDLQGRLNKDQKGKD